MARCITIVNYKMKGNPIFRVEFLSEKAFFNGFRVLNPEFKANINEIIEDTFNLKELLNNLDHTDELAFQGVTNDYMTQRKREEKRNPGGDRSTPPEVY